MRTPGTNPESAKIASRPLPLPLLRSLSFLLFFFLNLFPLPSANTPYPHPPTPGCGRSRPEAGEGGEVGAEVAGGGGKVATTKFKQTNTPTPRPPLPAPLGQKLCGRMRRAGAGDEAAPRSGARWGRGRSQGPQPRTGERRALALRAKVSEPRGCGVDFFFVFIYIFIPSLSLPSLPVLSHSSPRLLSQTTLATPLNTSFHTPAPQKTWGGKKVPLGFLGLRGGDKG